MATLPQRIPCPCGRIYEAGVEDGGGVVTAIAYVRLVSEPPMAWSRSMPDTINGFQIIATWATPKRRNEEAGRIIVADRGPEHEERYVVAWIGHTKQFWREAAYCVDLAEASRVFAKRIELEVSR